MLVGAQGRSQYEANRGTRLGKILSNVVEGDFIRLISGSFASAVVSSWLRPWSHKRSLGNFNTSFHFEERGKETSNNQEGGEKVYGSADLVKILARILDSERNFNGSADSMTTADRGLMQFLGPDFGLWLLGSSDRGSQRSPGNLAFSLLYAGYQAVEKMTRNSNALKRDGSVIAVMKVASYPPGPSHLSDLWSKVNSS